MLFLLPNCCARKVEGSEWEMTPENFRAQIIIIVMIMNCNAINTHTLSVCWLPFTRCNCNCHANRTSFHANKFSRTLFYAHIFRNKMGPWGCGRARNLCETGALESYCHGALCCTLKCTSMWSTTEKGKQWFHRVANGKIIFHQETIN